MTLEKLFLIKIANCSSTCNWSAHSSSPLYPWKRGLSYSGTGALYNSIQTSSISNCKSPFYPLDASSSTPPWISRNSTSQFVPEKERGTDMAAAVLSSCLALPTKLKNLSLNSSCSTASSSSSTCPTFGSLSFSSALSHNVFNKGIAIVPLSHLSIALQLSYHVSSARTQWRACIRLLRLAFEKCDIRSVMHCYVEETALT